MLFDHESAWADEQIYEEIYENSIKFPNEFWTHHIRDISWQKEPNSAFDEISEKWLSGGISNVCYNCVDRHALKNPNKPAIIWYGDEENDRREISFSKLLDIVTKIASILKSYSVKKGDVVGIYMPMVPEAIAAMLACARIGAIHLVIFAGFSAEALAYRLSSANAKVLLTINAFKRGGKEVNLSKNFDLLKSDIKIINLENLENYKVELTNEINWQNSEDDLFILYTSGSSGNPKKIVHSALPYMLYVTTTFKIIFGIKEDDVYFCTSDIGWITGHSYITYAPLFYGLTTVIFSGSPTYPTADRYWKIIEQEKVSIFYTAPTAIRSLQMFNKKFVKDHDLSLLRILGSVGEPINKSAWKWYFETVGNKKCPIMDTWWQTETGGIVIAPLRSLHQKPAVAGRPFFGIKTNIIDSELIIENKWPGICKTSKSHEVFKTGDGAIYDDNDIKINGRMDDVINISGHRLGTAEFECAINKINEVKESAVVAVPDEIKGQTAFAFVVLNDNQNSIPDVIKKIIKSTRNIIGPIAKADFVAFVPDLPKTRSGKIVRHLLRDVANNRKNLSEIHSVANPKAIEFAKIAASQAIFCPDMCRL